MPSQSRDTSSMNSAINLPTSRMTSTLSVSTVVCMYLSGTLRRITGTPPPETWKKRWAFVLLTAEFGVIRDGRVNYISNGEREDMVAMLRELLARFEGQPHQEGRA